MSPSRRGLFQRKRSEFDQIGRNNPMSFQHTLPELKTKLSIGQYTPYKSVMVDPALNFVNATRRQMKSTKSDGLEKANSKISVEVKETDESPDEDKSEKVFGPIDYKKKLLNAESAQLSLDKPMYQLSRRSFGIGYSLSPRQFATTSSKISLYPSQGQSKMSPSQSGFTHCHSPYSRVVKDQNLKLDAKECETEKNFQLFINPTEQKLILQSLLDFYHSSMMNVVSHMTPGNSASMSDLAQQAKRIAKSTHDTILRVQNLVTKEIDQMRGEVRRTQDYRDNMLAELNDFKQNRTIEAYFQRFQKIPNLEDRKILIQMIDQYLLDEKAAPKQESYGIRDQSAGADLVLQGLEEPSNVAIKDPEQSTLDAFEKRMTETLKEVKSVMLIEAEGVRRLTERNIRDKNALTGGRVPMKNKCTETLTWSVIHGKFQSVIDDANQKLVSYKEVTDRQLKMANSSAEARGKEIIILEQKVESLEQFKKRSNVQSIQRQMNDIIYNVLKNKLDGNDLADVLAKIQESTKMIDQNQEFSNNKVKKELQSIEGQKKAGLFKSKPIRNRDENVDVVQENDLDQAEVVKPYEVQVKSKNIGSQPFVMQKLDKQTLKVLEYNVIEISAILKETDQVVALFLTQKEMCLSLEGQIDLIGDAMKVVEKLPENCVPIISACEQSRNSNIGPTTLLQTLHLKNKTEQLISSEEFNKAKRIVAQFRSLPVIRYLIEEIKKVKDQEQRALKSEDEATKAQFMTDVVQTLCQILTAKEKLTLLPNKQGIDLFIDVATQVKEICALLAELLIPEQAKFLKQSSSQVASQKKAYDELLTHNSQLQRMVPKTLEQDKIKTNVAMILQQAIQASEKQAKIHKLDKDIFKLVIKTQDMIKNHINKADAFVATHSIQGKQLKLVQEEELEYRYDSDGEAVLVLKMQVDEQQANKGPEAPKAAQKLEPAKTVQKALVQQKAKLFTKEELDATVQKETKRKVLEAVNELQKKHEIEKKSLMSELEKAKISQQNQNSPQLENQNYPTLVVPQSKINGESTTLNSISRSGSRESHKSNKNENEARSPSPKKINIQEDHTGEEQLADKVITTPPPLKKAKPKQVVASTEIKPAQKPAKTVKVAQSSSPVNSTSAKIDQSGASQKPAKQIKVAQSSSSVNATSTQIDQSVASQKPKATKQVLQSNQDKKHSKQAIVKVENLQSSPQPSDETPTFGKPQFNQKKKSSQKLDSENNYKNTQSSMQQIQEEHLDENHHDQELVQTAKNESPAESKSVVLEQNLEAQFQNLSLKSKPDQQFGFEQIQREIEKNPNTSSVSFEKVNLQHDAELAGAQQNYFEEIRVQSQEQKERTDTWAPKNGPMNETAQTFVSEQPRQVFPIDQLGKTLNSSFQSPEKYSEIKKDSFNTLHEIDHLALPRFVASQIADQSKSTTSDRNLNLNVEIKPKRDFISDKPSYKPSINFKNENRVPLVPTPAEKDITREENASTIYDRTSQQSYHHVNLEKPVQEEINSQLNRSYHNQVTRRDSHSTLDEMLQPKLNNGNSLSPRSIKELNSDLALVQSSQPLNKKLNVISKNISPAKKSPKGALLNVENQNSQTHSADTLGEFLNIVSSAFDQLMSSMPEDPEAQKTIIKRISIFTDALLNIKKDFTQGSPKRVMAIDISHKLASPQVEINAQEYTVQEHSPTKKTSPKVLPSFSQFEQPGSYQLESKRPSKQRVTVKNVGRIGGGFIGHTAK